MTSALYCSMEIPLKSERDVADGAGRRVRAFNVSARMVLVLVGRAVGRLGSGLGDSSRSVVPRYEGLLRTCGMESSFRRDEDRSRSWKVSAAELDCMRAIANSRSIILTSMVLRRCSMVRLSSCCMVRTRLPTLGGRLIWSACGSDSGMDGATDALVTLVTVVPVEGLPEWLLTELPPSRGGDFESEIDSGTEVVRVGHVGGDSGRSSARFCNALILLDLRRA